MELIIFNTCIENKRRIKGERERTTFFTEDLFKILVKIITVFNIIFKIRSKRVLNAFF